MELLITIIGIRHWPNAQKEGIYEIIEYFPLKTDKPLITKSIINDTYAMIIGVAVNNSYVVMLKKDGDDYKIYSILTKYTEEQHNEVMNAYLEARRKLFGVNY